MEQKASVGHLSYEELNDVVTRWLERHKSEMSNGAGRMAMWTAKQDVWGRELRLERTVANAKIPKVVIRSAGLDGIYDGNSADDLTAVVFLTED